MADCPYCALHPCPDPWQHARDDAANETTWRRRANERSLTRHQPEAMSEINERGAA